LNVSDCMEPDYADRQRKLVEGMLRITKESGIIRRTCPFRNNDVPEFLKRLERFSEHSQGVKIVARYQFA